VVLHLWCSTRLLSKLLSSEGGGAPTAEVQAGDLHVVSALGGIRTPNLLIRSSGPGVIHRFLVVPNLAQKYPLTCDDAVSGLSAGNRPSAGFRGRLILTAVLTKSVVQ
jgi:hypothetical protein